MKKILLSLGTIAAVATPAVAITSCSEYTQTDESKILNLGVLKLDQDDYSYSINQKVVRANLGDLKRRELLMAKDMVAETKSMLVVGGFNEPRHFYSGSMKYNDIHLAYDLMVPAGTKVYAPYKGEVIMYSNPTKLTTTGTGVGSLLVEKVKISDLIDVDQKVLELAKRENKKFIYITIMHLSQNSTDLLKEHTNWIQRSKRSTLRWNDNITPSHPVTVTAGQLIGYVGKYTENGGWSPHAHVQYNFSGLHKYSKPGDYERGVKITSKKRPFDALSWTIAHQDNYRGSMYLNPEWFLHINRYNPKVVSMEFN